MSETEKVSAARPTRKPPQIASWRHLAGFFLIVAALAALGFYSQATKGPAGAGTGDLAKHSAAIGVYRSEERRVGKEC